MSISSDTSYPHRTPLKAIVDGFRRAGTNTSSLALRYILPTGWDNIDGKRFLKKCFQGLRLNIMVLYVDST